MINYIIMLDMPNRIRPQKQDLTKKEYGATKNAFSGMLRSYDLTFLNEEERKYLFTAFYISVVQSKRFGTVLQSFMRAIFEEVKDIIHGVQSYEEKNKEVKTVSITESTGYTNTLRAIIKYSYNRELKRNVICSIFVQQVQRY